MGFTIEAVNIEDAKQAKDYLYGHSRMVMEKVYINKFAKGSIRRKKGLDAVAVDEAFENAYAPAKAEMEKLTGYTIGYDKKRFLLIQAGKDDPQGMFTGNQMKVASLTEEQLKEHARVLMEFDRLCDQIVGGFRAEVEADGVPAEAVGA